MSGSVTGRRRDDVMLGDLPDDVRPGDGSSNSVLHYGRTDRPQWHGYVEHCVWNPR